MGRHELQNCGCHEVSDICFVLCRMSSWGMGRLGGFWMGLVGLSRWVVSGCHVWSKTSHSWESGDVTVAGQTTREDRAPQLVIFQMLCLAIRPGSGVFVWDWTFMYIVDNTCFMNSDLYLLSRLDLHPVRWSLPHPTWRSIPSHSYTYHCATFVYECKMRLIEENQGKLK